MLFMLQNMIQPQPDQQPMNPMMLGMMGASQPMPQPQYDQQQMPQQMPPQPPQESPLIRGAQSARQAVTLNDEQQRRAIGMAMMRFFSNMSKPSYRDRSGFNGALSRANESFLPAAEEYWQQHDQSMAQNQEEAQIRAAEMRRAEDIERANQKEAMQQDRWEREFEETQRAHKANEDYRIMDRFRGGKLSAAERKELKKEENIERAAARNAISFDTYTNSELGAEQKRLNEEIKSAGRYQETLRTIKKMKDIFQEDPKIGSAWYQIIDSNDDPNVWEQIKRLFVRKKDLARLEKLRKYGANLNLDLVMGMKGQRATDLLKKFMKATNPGSNFTSEGAISLLNDIENVTTKKIKNIPIYRQSLKDRMFYPDYDVQEILNQYGFESPETPTERNHIPAESKAQPLNSMDEDAEALERIAAEKMKRRGNV